MTDKTLDKVGIKQKMVQLNIFTQLAVNNNGKCVCFIRIICYFVIMQILSYEGLKFNFFFFLKFVGIFPRTKKFSRFFTIFILLQ